jgi:hypothetical protein
VVIVVFSKRWLTTILVTSIIYQVAEVFFNINKQLLIGQIIAKVGLEAGFAFLVMTIAYFIRWTLIKTYSY